MAYFTSNFYYRFDHKSMEKLKYNWQRLTVSALFVQNIFMQVNCYCWLSRRRYVGLVRCTSSRLKFSRYSMSSIKRCVNCHAPLAHAMIYSSIAMRMSVHDSLLPVSTTINSSSSSLSPLGDIYSFASWQNRHFGGVFSAIAPYTGVGPI